MKIHELINHFSSQVSVPIDPDDVAQQIKNAGIRDIVSFVSVKLETRVLKGALHSYVIRNGLYGEAVLHSDVYYSDSLTRDWKRFVCCKELLHILDSSVSQAAKPEDVEGLISGLCRISDRQESPLTMASLRAWDDHLMTYYAIAILFPNTVRDLLMPPFTAKLIDIEQISERLDLPAMAVSLVMSDDWPNLHKALMGKK